MAHPALMDEDAPAPPHARGRTRYADDLYTWVQEQVALLRAGRVDALDLDNIAEHRERAQIQLRKSPGLKSSLEEIRRDGFRLGRLGAARQMKRSLKTLPADCPYGWDEILHRPFAFDDDR